MTSGMLRLGGNVYPLLTPFMEFLLRGKAIKGFTQNRRQYNSSKAVQAMLQLFKNYRIVDECH